MAASEHSSVHIHGEVYVEVVCLSSYISLTKFKKLKKDVHDRSCMLVKTPPVDPFICNKSSSRSAVPEQSRKMIKRKNIATSSLKRVEAVFIKKHLLKACFFPDVFLRHRVWF